MKYLKIKGMKRYILIVSLICGVIMGSFHLYDASYAQEIESEQVGLSKRFLKADGKVLRNNAGKGEIVTLRGTNIGGWHVMEAWMSPTNSPDQKTTINTLTQRFGEETAEELIKIYENAWLQEQDLDNIKELNFNVIRVPISYFNLLGEDGMLREDTLATYDWLVEECAKREIYVILDLHAAPGSQNGRDHSGDISGSKLFTDESAQNQTVSIWEQLAEHYRGNPTIAGYDLLNEPEGNDVERAPWGKVQLPFFDRLYKAIRAIDPDHIIVFNAVWEPVNMPDPSTYGWENIVYEYHYYGWDGTDSVVAQRKFTESKVANDKKAGHEVPVLIGEFTLFDKLSSWEHALKIYEENGWSWTTWTYKTVDQGSWGIFNSKTSTTPKVNIYNDSIETIKEKWSKVDTASSFTKNKYLYDLLSVMADKEVARQNPRKWFQNVTTEVDLRAGTDAKAEVVSGSDLSSYKGDSNLIRLIVTGSERMPTATSRNVCISPTIRDSVDATGMEYLIINAHTQQGNRALNITLVDKSGAIWSGFTSPAAMPVSQKWEKLFIDITKANIDITAIMEIRIGVNVPGTYYFNDIYFASSYSDYLPDESVETMEKDMGELGVILDWDNVKGSSIRESKDMNWLAIVSIVVIGIVAIAAVAIVMKRKKKKKIN